MRCELSHDDPAYSIFTGLLYFYFCHLLGFFLFVGSFFFFFFNVFSSANRYLAGYYYYYSLYIFCWDQYSDVTCRATGLWKHFERCLTGAEGRKSPNLTKTLWELSPSLWSCCSSFFVFYPFWKEFWALGEWEAEGFRDDLCLRKWWLLEFGKICREKGTQHCPCALYVSTHQFFFSHCDFIITLLNACEICSPVSMLKHFATNLNPEYKSINKVKFTITIICRGNHQRTETMWNP